jgi:hypothetical protein
VPKDSCAASFARAPKHCYSCAQALLIVTRGLDPRVHRFAGSSPAMTRSGCRYALKDIDEEALARGGERRFHLLHSRSGTRVEDATDSLSLAAHWRQVLALGHPHQDREHPAHALFLYAKALVE